VRNIGHQRRQKGKDDPGHADALHCFSITEQKKRRVAGYARVSTDHDDQFTSYEAQIDYYTNYIRSRDDWEFVDVYTDEGITGTSTKRREGFKRMVADALAGRIDLIVTKSVSRFARNTVDSLTTIRKLKEKGVECYFEKENIWTFDGKGELLITIMSSLAQEESRSISENCTWGQRKRFADGKVTIPFNRFLGYDRGANGELVVNPEQAKVVRSIYDMFLQGTTYHGIAQKLTDDGIKTPGGKDKWSISTVKSILSNEKYKGDALLQKCFTVDYLTKKQKKNEGEIPQYYVEGNHEAIIRLKNSTWFSGKWPSAAKARSTTAAYIPSPAKSGAASVEAGTAQRSGTRPTNTAGRSGNAITSMMAASTAALRT
jgi:DNA invertase Pin-like site-specific DNA recombinase